MTRLSNKCTCLEVFGEDPTCELHGGPLRLAVFETFGGRCNQFDPECETCQAWAEIDRLEALTACQQEVERLRGELIKSRDYWSEQYSDLNRRNAELVKALEPFADAIFNDNGDVTFNHAAFDDDDLFRAYSLLKRAALKGQSNEA